MDQGDLVYTVAVESRPNEPTAATTCHAGDNAVLEWEDGIFVEMESEKEVVTDATLDYGSPSSMQSPLIKNGQSRSRKPRPRRGKVSADEWETMKETIARYYIHENYTLPKVREIMSRHPYNFHAS